MVVLAILLIASAAAMLIPAAAWSTPNPLETSEAQVR
jgi:hypothetical protein